MALVPITEVGSTTTQLTYGEGDFIGVEASATEATDHLGFNEAADFTVRFDDTLQVEHYVNGCHDTVRVARCVLVIDWDGTTYTANGASYVQTTAGVVTRGGGFSITRNGAGDVTITLTNAVTTGPTMIVDLTPMYEDPTTATAYRVRVMRYTYTSTTVFALRRYAGTSVSTMALTDGPMHVMVHT